MEKVVRKRKLEDLTPHDDLEYWMSKTPEERVNAVEELRQQYYGTDDPPRLQRVLRVIKELHEN